MESNPVCTCGVVLYPWAKKSLYEYSVSGLKEQINDFINWIAPTEGKLNSSILPS
jgi:hypothetical protein